MIVLCIESKWTKIRTTW